MIPETDEVLVNRNGTTYKTTAENMANLEDTDLMLVNRDGVTYTVTGEEIKDSIQAEEAPDITSVVLTQNQVNADRYTSNQFTSTVNYAKDPFPPASIEMTAKVEGALGLEASTSDIISNDYVGTSSTSVPLELADNTFLNDGTYEVGDVVKASESYTPETDVIDEVIPAAVTSVSTNMNYVAPNGTPFPNTAYDFNKAIYDGQSSITYQVNFNPGVDFNSTLKLAVDSSRPNEVITANFLNAGNVEVTNRLDGQNPFNINQIWVYNGNDTLLSVSFNGEYANNTGCGFRGIWFDDKEFTEVSGFNQIPQSGTVSDGPPYDSLKLTSDKDINLFQVGDVVQSDWNQDQTWSNDIVFGNNNGSISVGATAAFDGNTATSPFQSNTQAADNTSGKIYWRPNLNYSSKVEAYAGSTLAGQGYSFNSGGYVGLPGTEGWVTIATGSGTITELYTDRGNTNSAVYFSAVRVDGELLVDPNIPAEGVKITATDVSAKTITVDGGNWDTTNQSQVWSAALTCPEPWATGKTPEYAFNGNVGDVFTTPDDVADVTFTPEVGIPYTTSIEVYMGSTGGTGIILNDSITVGINPGSWTKINGSGVLNKLVLAPGDKVTLGGIKVDGKLLVDKVNDSSTWSGGLSLPDGIASGTYTNQFDGNPSTYANPASASNSWSWLCPETIVLTENIKLKPPFVENFNYTWSIGGNSGTSVTITDTGWYELQGTEGRTVSPGTPLVIGANTSSVAPKFTGMMVNGVLLVDQGVRNFGDTKVSTVSPKQGQGTISDITGSDVTINPYTDNCFKEGQFLSHVTPKQILITPQTDDITDVTGDVLTFSSDKDLLNFAAGDTVSMVNADGTAATYVATTSEITDAVQVVKYSEQDRTGEPAPYRGSYAVLFDGNESGADTSWGVNTDWVTLATLAFTGTKLEFKMTSSNNLRVRFDNDPNTEFTWSGSGDVWAVVPTPATFTTIQTAGLSEAYGMFGIKVNDILLADSQVTAGTILSFTDSTDLQYFKDGDVVQSPDGTDASQDWLSKTTVTGSYTGDLTVLYDANNTTRLQTTSKPGSLVTELDISDDPIAVTAFTLFAPYLGSESFGRYNASIEFNDTGSVSVNPPQSNGIDVYDLFINKVPDGILKKVKYTYNGNAAGGQEFFGYSWYSLRINNKYLYQIDSNIAKVIGTPSLDPPQMTVSTGTWSNGDTITKSVSGTGEVVSTDPITNTMVLNNSNNEWVTGYYVETSEKPAIAQIGYLKFGSSGNVTGVTLAAQPAVIMANANPVLTFPAQFGTGETPDTELPYPTKLQTTITASNTFIDLTVNTSTASSNVLLPATTTFLGPASGTSRYTGTGVAQLTANLTTFSGREAAANTDPTDVQGSLAAKQTEIDDYIAGL